MPRYSVAASGEVRGPEGVREPAGALHAWIPGTNQTLCGVPLHRAGLRRFSHETWEYHSTDVLTPADRIGWLCPDCLAAAGPRRRDARRWQRHNARP